jgi:fucose permease
VVGRLVEGGVAWQAVVLGTAFAAVPLAILFAAVRLPSGRHVTAHGASTVRVGLALPLVLLAIAIACYVGSEVGVSNWLVRFLEAAPLGLATSALALFWGCLTLGRLASAAWSDRFDHARFAAVASVAAAIALIGAVVVPSLAGSIVLFGVVGFAFGPIYPLIMAVAGDRYPARTAAVSGFLSGFAVVGAIVYPPLMGFVSVAVGLGVAMAGRPAWSSPAGSRCCSSVGARPRRSSRARPDSPPRDSADGLASGAMMREWSSTATGSARAPGRRPGRTAVAAGRSTWAPRSARW